MKRSNRGTLVLLAGGGLAVLAAAGLLARPSAATVADTTCPADMTAILKNLSPPTVPIGVSVVRSFTLTSSRAVSAVHLSAPDGYNATQLEAKDGAYGLQLTAPRAGAFTIQATWSEFYMVDNGDGTNAGATCSGAGSVALTAVRPTAVAPANSHLPAAGDWRYDQVPSTKFSTGKSAVFQAYLRIQPGKSSVYSFAVVVSGGTCKRGGKVFPDSLVGGSSSRTLIPIKPDGSFSGTRNAVGDEAGSKGTVRLKGVFDGAHVSGTVTAHIHYPVLGDCQGTAKFVAKGVRIA
jgi:hypothetical protein